MKPTEPIADPQLTIINQRTNRNHATFASIPGTLWKSKNSVMNNLMKSTRYPTFNSLLEDFWRNDLGLRAPFENGGQLPAVNIKENDKTFEIEVAAPGFQKQDFKVDTDNQGRLTITAESKKETDEEKANYARHEFSYSSFSRTFNLPETVKQEDIKARYQDGVLQLTLVKSSESQPQKKMIPIE